MNYSYDITITTENTSDNLKVEKLDVPNGYLREIHFIIPQGPSNLVYFSIWHKDSQIYPQKNQQWYHGDDIEIKFADSKPLQGTPSFLEFKGYGIGCNYDHTITVIVNILPYGDPSIMLTKILNTLERITRWF